jgi:hypothetical protein
MDSIIEEEEEEETRTGLSYISDSVNAKAIDEGEGAS